jgi:predicted negative regulator of RcsB-dependent stress response
MSRNVLYLIVAALAVAAVVFGYQLYQERQKTSRVEINVGKGGISIEKK